MSEAQTKEQVKKAASKPVATTQTAPATVQGTATPSAEKKETVYTPVKMADGRTVEFAGARKVQKPITVGPDFVEVQFDFRNGKTLKINSKQLSNEVSLRALGHGLSQKVGDEFSGTTEVDDMFLEAEAMVNRLVGGEWGAAREAGDSMKGASVVIQAICEVSGLPVEKVKAYLDGKLEAAKAKGEKLTRQELYASFRNPTTDTGKVIKRIEEEKQSKSAKFNAADLISELKAA